MNYITLILTFILLLLGVKSLDLPTTPPVPLRALQPWTVSGFRAFNAASGPEGVSEVSFRLSSSATNVSTQCGQSLAPGSGHSTIDPSRFYSCEDGLVSFKYGGSWLAVIMNDTNTGRSVGVENFGNVTLSLTCYNTTVEVQVLDGTTCESPTVSFSLPVLNSNLVQTVGSHSSNINTLIPNNSYIGKNDSGSPQSSMVANFSTVGSNATWENNLVKVSSSALTPKETYVYTSGCGRRYGM